jgi:hypothetical protein
MKSLQVQRLETAIGGIDDALIEMTNADRLTDEIKVRKPRSLMWQFAPIAAGLMVVAGLAVAMLYFLAPDNDVAPPHATDIDGVTWLVGPNRAENAHILYCEFCDEFVATSPFCPLSHDTYIVDEKTAEITEQLHDLHSGNPAIWVYEPEEDLFGLFYTGRIELMLFPRSEFALHFPDEVNSLNRVWQIDAQFVQQVEDRELFSRLPNEMPNAVAIGGDFLTDFDYYFNISGRRQRDIIEVRNNDWKTGIIDRSGNLRVPLAFDSVLIIDATSAFALIGDYRGIIAIPPSDSDSNCGEFCTGHCPCDYDDTEMLTLAELARIHELAEIISGNSIFFISPFDRIEDIPLCTLFHAFMRDGWFGPYFAASPENDWEHGWYVAHVNDFFRRNFSSAFSLDNYSLPSHMRRCEDSDMVFMSDSDGGGNIRYTELEITQTSGVGDLILVRATRRERYRVEVDGETDVLDREEQLLYTFVRRIGGGVDIVSLQLTELWERTDTLWQSPTSLVLPDIGIRPDMLPIVTAFLEQFPTIHTDLIIPARQTDEYGNVTYWHKDWRTHCYDAPRTTETPDIYFVSPLWETPAGGGGYFDRNGNRLSEEDHLWIWDDKYATHFSLTDWTGSGVPEIHIIYLGHNTFPGHWNDDRLFRFVDGEYRLVTSRREEMLNSSSRLDDNWTPGGYFADAQGNLYFQMVWVDGSSIHPFRFDANNVAHFSSAIASTGSIYVVGIDYDCPDWQRERDEWYDLFPCIYGNTVPQYIPGTDIWVTPLAYHPAPQNQAGR